MNCAFFLDLLRSEDTKKITTWLFMHNAEHITTHDLFLSHYEIKRDNAMKIQGLREICSQRSYKNISIDVMEEADRAFVEWSILESQTQSEQRPLSKIDKGQMCQMGTELLEQLRAKNMLPKDSQGKKIKFCVKIYRLGDYIFKFIESAKNDCIMLCYYPPITTLESASQGKSVRPQLMINFEKFRQVLAEVYGQQGTYLEDRVRKFCDQVLAKITLFRNTFESDRILAKNVKDERLVNFNFSLLEKIMLMEKLMNFV